MKQYWKIACLETLRCIVIEAEEQPKDTLPYNNETFEIAKFDRFPKPRKVEPLDIEL